jgi:predicted deacylase
VQGADDNHLATAAAAGAAAFAVQLESTINAGDPLSAVLSGEATAIAGAAVAAGQYVITNAAGQFVPSVAIGDLVTGRALSSAAVAGDEFVLLVQPFIR